MPDQHDPTVTTEFCLANARIVLSDRVVTGAVHVIGDRIAGLTEGDRIPAGAQDMCGDYIIAGLVELHTDNLERHLEPRPSVKMPHNSAILAHDGELASTGITTVFDALRAGTMRGRWEKRYAREVATEILDLRAAGALRVRHMIHLRAEVSSETLVEELASFGPEDRVKLLSVMDHSPGQRQFRDLVKLRTYYKGKYGYSDADFESFMESRTALAQRVRATHEAAAVSAAARLGAALASHDDTTTEHVTKSRDMGMALAEFPTTLEAAEACREAGVAIIMGAPNLIRGGSHSGNVSAIDLADAGLLDIVSSDYVPSLLMASAFRLAELWDDLPRAIATVTTTPADATELTDRGRIAEDCLADLVRVGRHGETAVIRAVWRGGERVG